MQERESLNPYAAPKAQPDMTGTVPPRRPASVKWATFVMGLFTVVLGVLYWQAIEEQGVETIWKQLTPFDRALLLPLGLGLGLFGGRRKVSYYGIAAILAMIVIQSLLLLFVQWSASGAFERPFLGQRFCRGTHILCSRLPLLPLYLRPPQPPLFRRASSAAFTSVVKSC